MRDAADLVSAHILDVENLDAGVEGALDPAQDAVEGLLADALAHAPARVKLGTYAVMQRTLFAAAAAKLFARFVDAYNNEVAGLREEWQGFEEPEEGAAADEIAAADTAKHELAARLRLRRQALEIDLDHGANVVKWTLAAGICDESIVMLWNTGALPMGAVAAFPGSDYMSQVNPVARWMHLVYMGVIPGDELYDPQSEQATVDNVVAFLAANPHLAVEFDQLLGMERLAEPERLYLQGLGQWDSQRVNAVLQRDDEPGPSTLDEIADGTGRLRDINARIAAGERVTLGERRYWQGWFGGIDAEVLAGLPAHVEEAINTPEMMLGVSQADEDQYRQRLRDQSLGPIADSIMHMSNPQVVYGPNTDTVIHLSDMPEVVQRLATTQIGSASSDGQTFSLSDNRMWTPHVAGIEEFAGFADLMATSTVRGGDQFTYELGQEAIRAQGQLDEIAGSYDPSIDAVRDELNDRLNATLPDGAPTLSESNPELDRQITEHVWRDTYGPSDETVSNAIDTLEELLDQGSGATSTMLSVVARNDTASSMMLNDDHVLPSLLTADWWDDSGAAAVIAVGTDRDPAGGGGTALQADAARALFVEAGTTAPGQMTDGVASAAVDAGIEWIDAFAAGSSTGEPSVSLPSDAQQDYLRFVAATGTGDVDDPGTRFGYAVQVNAVDWIADGLSSGDAAHLDDAMERAATLDGSLVRAIYEQRMDVELAHPAAAHATSVAKQQQMALLGDAASHDDVWAVWRETDGSQGAIDPAVVDATLPVSLARGEQVPNAESAAPTAPEVFGETYERTFDEGTHGAAGSRDYLLLIAAQAAQGDGATEPLQPYAEVRDEVWRAGGGSLHSDAMSAVSRVYPGTLPLARYDDAWEAASHTRFNEMQEDLNRGD
jgi:hypothetical protein